MSATLPAIEFSIGIMALKFSSFTHFLKQSSNVLQAISSVRGKISSAASCEYAPSFP